MTFTRKRPSFLPGAHAAASATAKGWITETHLPLGDVDVGRSTHLFAFNNGRDAKCEVPGAPESGSRWPEGNSNSLSSARFRRKPRNKLQNSDRRAL